MSEQFHGKVAVVTGAGTGIGAATASLLAARGASVVLAGIEVAPLDAVAGAIRERAGTALVVRADVSRLEDNEAMVRAAVERFGALHYAVNNAGISGEPSDLANTPVEQWRKVMGTNIDGVFFGLKFELPAIVAAGGGAVVNIASVYASISLPKFDAYTASKHSVVGLTKSAAVDYSERNVRINAVLPGPIWTPIMEDYPTETARTVARVPMKRIGRPEEIAAVVAFLLSDEASFMAGASVVVDGGLLLE